MSALKEKKISAKAMKEEEASQLPSAEIAKENVEKLFAILRVPYLQSFLQRLHNLAKKPPQVILIDGANEQIRYAFSIYYACMLNCTEKTNIVQAPCMNCPSCLEIANTFSPDFIIFDGLKESIKIDPIRELIPVIANAPSFLKTRIVLFSEASAFTLGSANALLKTLEEPNNTTHFIMSVNSRDKLFSTLVSRSLIFTLPTEVHGAYSDEDIQILNALHYFFTEGKGWFESYTSKKDFTIHQARQVIRLLMSSIALSFTTESKSDSHAFVDFLSKKLNSDKTYTCLQFIDESSEILENSTSPKIDLIIDCLLVQMYMLLNDAR